MLTSNNTPLAGLGFEQWHRDGGTMACVVARGSFWFDFEERAIKLEEEQGIVLADEFDGDPQTGALLKVNDLVPFKPTTDVTFLGNIYAEHEEPKDYINAYIEINSHKTSIRGWGARNWFYKRKKGWLLSEPEPVSLVEVSYKNAVGGRIIGDPNGDVDPRNPIGPGVIDDAFTPQSMEFAAPTIDSEEHPIAPGRMRKSLPQGFGAMSPWWQARSCHVGTYDDEWLENTHPRLPKDFDYSHYQFAHPNLIMPNYLNGNENIVTYGLVKGGEGFRFKLPDVAPWVHFAFRDGRIVNTRLNLDGVHIDFRTDRYKLDLTWRAWMETCPSFYRIDLESIRLDEVDSLELTRAEERGLVI